jgi:molecular chaperone DnaK
MAADNKSLGRFILDGIPPAMRGMPQVEVTFDIDSNGILHVTAKDKTSGKEQKITIQNSTNLSEEEVERMKADAEKHAEEDKRKKEVVETRNRASQVAFELDKQIKDYGDKVDKEVVEKVKVNVEQLKKLVEKPDATKEELEKATEETLTSAQKIGEAMMKAQQQAGQPATEGPAKPEAAAEAKPDDQAKKSDAKKDAEEGEVIS